jgi:hypothetical protein
VGGASFTLEHPAKLPAQPANNVARPASDSAPFARPWASLANRLAGVATLLASDIKPLAKGSKSPETPDFQGFFRLPKKHRKNLRHFRIPRS